MIGLQKLATQDDSDKPPAQKIPKFIDHWKAEHDVYLVLSP